MPAHRCLPTRRRGQRRPWPATGSRVRPAARTRGPGSARAACGTDDGVIERLGEVRGIVDGAQPPDDDAAGFIAADEAPDQRPGRPGYLRGAVADDLG